MGRFINADVNRALNISRKVIGDGFFIKDLINRAVVLNPVKIMVTDLSNQTLLNSLVRC